MLCRVRRRCVVHSHCISVQPSSYPPDGQRDERHVMPTSSTSSSRRRTYIGVLASIDRRPQARSLQFQIPSVREHSHRHAHTGGHRDALAQYIPRSIYARKISDGLHDDFGVYAGNNLVASVRQDERCVVASGYRVSRQRRCVGETRRGRYGCEVQSN